MNKICKGFIKKYQNKMPLFMFKVLCMEYNHFIVFQQILNDLNHSIVSRKSSQLFLYTLFYYAQNILMIRSTNIEWFIRIQVLLIDTVYLRCPPSHAFSENNFAIMRFYQKFDDFIWKQFKSYFQIEYAVFYEHEVINNSVHLKPEIEKKISNVFNDMKQHIRCEYGADKIYSDILRIYYDI
jgi:hypothetical protein